MFSNVNFCTGCLGAGNGTLCFKLASGFGWAHISIGDELRRLSQDCDRQDDAVKSCVGSATSVPEKYLAQVLEVRMAALREPGYSSFIVDGFPRYVDQIQCTEEKLGNRCPSRVV